MEERKKLHIGRRNIQTAIAVLLCALVYLLVDRNPTFACIGAVFGTGRDMKDSRLNGGNRFFGTLMGGLLGMGLFRLYLCVYPDGKTRPLILLFLVVGVMALILISRLLWPGAVQPGGVVLCILLFNTPAEAYLSYSVNRIIDTGIGVVFALLVNWLLPRERLGRWMDHAKGKKTPEAEETAEKH